MDFGCISSGFTIFGHKNDDSSDIENAKYLLKVIISKLSNIKSIVDFMDEETESFDKPKETISNPKISKSDTGSICDKCDNINPQNSKFCNSCGSVLR